MCDILIGRLELGRWETLSVIKPAWQQMQFVLKKIRLEILQILEQVAPRVPGSHNKQFRQCVYSLVTGRISHP